MIFVNTTKWVRYEGNAKDFETIETSVECRQGFPVDKIERILEKEYGSLLVMVDGTEWQCSDCIDDIEIQFQTTLIYDQMSEDIEQVSKTLKQMLIIACDLRDSLATATMH